MNIALYEKFNALSDKKRFDIVHSIDQPDALRRQYGFESSDTGILALQVDANWEWGISGADKPHPHMNVIGIVAETKFRGRVVWGWTPYGERYGTSNVSSRNYLIIEDVNAFEASLESAMKEPDSSESSSALSENATLTRWGKLAGILKG